MCSCGRGKADLAQNRSYVSVGGSGNRVSLVHGAEPVVILHVDRDCRDAGLFCGSILNLLSYLL